MEKKDYRITFGKYKDCHLSDMLRDRNYCKWFLEQDFTLKKYEFIFNIVRDWNPLSLFYTKKEETKESNAQTITSSASSTQSVDARRDSPTLSCEATISVPDFIQSYPYFNLNREIKQDEIVILTDKEKMCYEYYLNMLKHIENEMLAQNSFAIKAPTKWLKKLEKDYNIPREDFKSFLSSFELPNITSIIEDVKKQANIDYKGAKSYLIAKNNSLIQEGYYEKLLKTKYGEKIAVQYLYENCVFDFFNIETKTIIECKLGLKDFVLSQYKKYVKLGVNVIYVFGKEIVIDFEKRKVYLLQSVGFMLADDIDLDGIDLSEFERIVVENIESVL
jgi:hypothetical protein